MALMLNAAGAVFNPADQVRTERGPPSFHLAGDQPGWAAKCASAHGPPMSQSDPAGWIHWSRASADRMGTAQARPFFPTK